MLPDCTRDILGIWIENTEGAKFWMKVFNDLKTRGVNDILIAVTDGLKGMPEALVSTANDWVINCAMNDVRCSAVKSSLISAQFDPLDLKRSSNSTTFRSLSSMDFLPRNSSSFPHQFTIFCMQLPIHAFTSSPLSSVQNLSSSLAMDLSVSVR